MFKKFFIAISTLIIIFTIIYWTIGIFVIQPIGLIPEGKTVIYWRIGTQMPFITSADGILLKDDGKVFLFGRAIVLGTVIVAIKDRIIIKVPYSESLYLISTGGKQFEN